jgi:hypothetical protein
MVKGQLYWETKGQLYWENLGKGQLYWENLGKGQLYWEKIFQTLWITYWKQGVLINFSKLINIVVIMSY